MGYLSSGHSYTMSTDELKKLYKLRISERAQQDEVTRRKLTMHPYCGIIPSPEKLDKSYNSRGEDVTNTRGDFKLVWGWLSDCPNIGFYSEVKTTVDRDEQLELPVFTSVIRSAFQAFDSIRNTHYPEAEQMVLLYYTGHGLSVEGATRLNGAHSSSPLLENVGYHYNKEYFSAAQPNLPTNRNVKGGELCLHDVGFCDLQGLLEPWTAAVKKESTERFCEKHNKHVVIIADSCYSGKLVEDLNKLSQTRGPWNENGCTVTVQSACSSEEPTYGGYFTPRFVYYNQPENEEKLKQLIEEWNGKNEIEKDAYREFTLPSPQVATTRAPENVDSENDPVLKVFLQGFRLYLFRDAGFFKFCCVEDSIKALGPPRALNNNSVGQFLSQRNFSIMDYKLKRMRNGTPMALVLVNNPHDQKHVICVHIHFNDSITELGNISGVNLVEHRRPKRACPNLLFLASDYRRAKWYLNPGEHALLYSELVKQCKSYVEAKEPGRWGDVTRWNMGKDQLGVNHMFKMRERSAWMDNYLNS